MQSSIRIIPFARVVFAASCFCLAIASISEGQSTKPKRGFGGVLESPSVERVKAHQLEAFANILSLPSLQIYSQSTEVPKDTHAIAKAKDANFSWHATKYLTEVRDQGTCGSCSIFGCIASAEANWAIRHNGQLVDMSEQHIVNCLDGSCCGGWKPSDVMDYLLKTGTCSEQDDGYNSKFPSVQECKTAPVSYKAVARAYVAADGRVPTSVQLKEAILKHGPISVFIYADGFENFYDSDEVIHSNSKSGPHEVVIVGWDDNKHYPSGKGAWEIRNSWGPTWGRNGYAFVAYGVRDIGDNALWVEFQTDAQGPNLILESNNALETKQQE